MQVVWQLLRRFLGQSEVVGGHTGGTQHSALPTANPRLQVSLKDSQGQTGDTGAPSVQARSCLLWGAHGFWDTGPSPY